MTNNDLSNRPAALSPLKRAFLAIEELQAKLAASEQARRGGEAGVVGAALPLPGRELALAGTNERRFESVLKPSSPGAPGGQSGIGAGTATADTLREVVRATGRTVLGAGTVELRDFSVLAACEGPEEEARTIQTVARPATDGEWEVRIFGRTGETWTLHAAGFVRGGFNPMAAVDPGALSVGRNGGDRCPMSAGQEALWFIHQTAPDNPAYNTALTARLLGALDRTALRRAVEALGARHPLLRATVELEGGQPWLQLGPEARVEWTEVEAQSWDTGTLSLRIEAEADKPFLLERGPLVRVALFRVAAEEHVLLLGLHHLITDARTNTVLLAELRQFYVAAHAGRAVVLPAPAGTYAGFVRWQRALLAGADGEALWNFWRDALAGELPALALPTDYARPAVLAPAGAAVPIVLSVATWQTVRDLARANGTTPFAVLLAVFHVFLHRHSGQDDLIVGTPTSGRSRAEFDDVAGYFVNPVPLRARLAGRPSFTDFLDQVRRTVLGALAHADYPLVRLVERLNRPRDPGRSPLFQAFFVYQQRRKNATHEAGDWGGLVVEEFPLGQMQGQFELTLELFEDGGGSLKFHTALFAPETGARFAQRFRTLLDGILADPSRRIDELPLLDVAERHLVVRQWNDTGAALAATYCLHELVAQQVARTPDAVAVVYEGASLSYGELEARANQLAHWLRGAGVRPDTLVGVCAERSVELVVALLGILKAGGAYVPLDPDYPQERLAFMLEDAGVKVLLTQERFSGLTHPKILRLDADWAEVAGEAGSTPNSGVTPDHLAYMIYTSGSTGRPKGASNSHRAIVNRLLWLQAINPLTPADAVVQKTPFSFDVSVWEFFWPLLTGARLVVARPGGHQDAAYLADLVVRERVTTMHFVPSMLQVFVASPGLARCTTLRQVLCSGEALSFELQERFFARHSAELHNLYGPTEAAVEVAYWRCERGSVRRVVPIGRPITGVQLYVLDSRFQPVPVGVAGELHIGGIALARGYHRRPELTAEKFIPDPFGGSGARLYRTGDRARWLPDGAIEYLGRFDHQVKIRGFRIELGEIESTLARQPGVREAVAIARDEGAGEQRLVAYLVTDLGVPVVVAELRRSLRASLPEYMVPADFVVLPALPLLPNGKIDRRALPAPSSARPEIGARFVAPATPTEQAIAALWREVLGRDHVGVEDNFFDLGGHSLRLGQVHARLQTLFPQPPALVELFEYPTVRTLAARLDAVAAGKGGGGGSDGPPARTATAGRMGRGDSLSDQRAIRRAAREGRRA